jgi:hypothetical protein
MKRTIFLVILFTVVLPVSLRAGETLPGRDTLSGRDTLPGRDSLPDWRFALRSNALVPGLNAGVQFATGRHLSLAADWYYPWFWPARRNLRCTELLGLGLELRYWFRDGLDPAVRWTGHSLAFGMMAGYYDFERRGSGIQGEYALAAVDYGYSFSLWEEGFRLMLCIGVGWLHTRYRPYQVHEPYGQLFRTGDWTETLDWVGPVRAEVSLIIPFRLKYKKEVQP